MSERENDLAHLYPDLESDSDSKNKQEPPQE
jgi:hypothetical protein